MKPMEIIVLGTSAMVPTKDRNQSAVLLRHGQEGLLFDCGESVQKQLQIVGIPANRITRIFLTHWHGDHTLGLPGLLQTISAQTPGAAVTVYGPRHTREKIRALLDVFEFHQRLNLRVEEINGGVILETEDFFVETKMLEHGIPCLGYAFVERDVRRIDLAKAKKKGVPEGPLIGKLQQGEAVTVKSKRIIADEVSYLEKGRKVAYIVDTKLCKNAIDLASNADILLSEAIYTGDMEDKAEQYNHMTAAQAAQLARQANVKKLVLTHFSARYKTVHDVIEDAKDTFPNVVGAYDFMKINL